VSPGTLTTASFVLLVLALILALAFEFVNGFHDTANAVATVIYTRALRPTVAVVWSGIWNLLGVMASSGAVAFAMVALLPVEMVLHVGTGTGFAMVFAVLLSSMIWNLGTWFLGLPASSSHTLIGSILGVGLAYSVISPVHTIGEGVNWVNAEEVGLSLMISPVVGFCCAGGLLMLSQLVFRRPELFQPPKGDSPPPFWVRALLILTCTGVSFAHGSNDGQKGMGLIMLILIGILPGAYALNTSAGFSQFEHVSELARSFQPVLQQHAGSTASGDANTEIAKFLQGSGKPSTQTFAALAVKNDEIANELLVANPAQRSSIRADIYMVAKAIGKMTSLQQFSPDEGRAATQYRIILENLVNFIPAWVKSVVAVTLGLGTMIGWKRIVVTVGEKIGKAHLSYGQGAAAEFVAMGTIAAADWFGLPVSTTHVLSSGIAGTMAANRSGLQMDTLRNLCLAWVLTLPACVLLGATLFAAGFYVFLNVVGLR
jgi:inorganic phosphate transporter, PiT family